MTYADFSVQPEIALGHFLTLRRPKKFGTDSGNFADAGDGYLEIRFQNFWIQEDAIWQDPAPGAQREVHSFLPFGFSGISVNRSGDNVDASLVFPNNELARSFADNAVREVWTGVVRVVWINNLTDASDPPQLLMRYSGLVSSASWSETTISLKLNTLLDAVSTDVPARTMHQQTIGNVPVSGNLAL